MFYLSVPLKKSVGNPNHHRFCSPNDVMLKIKVASVPSTFVSPWVTGMGARNAQHQQSCKRTNLCFKIHQNPPGYLHKFNWLVLSTPLKNMSSSVGVAIYSQLNGKSIKIPWFQTAHQSTFAGIHDPGMIHWLHFDDSSLKSSLKSMDWFKGKFTGNHRFSH